LRLKRRPIPHTPQHQSKESFMPQEPIDLGKFDHIEGYWSDQAKEIEHEIERIGAILGIDWNDEVQVRALASESLHHAREDVENFIARSAHDDYQLKEKITLFALADMMMRIMAKTADRGVHTHGAPAWKAFSKALMKERGISPTED
jgi:hypothetical protein